MSLLGAGLAVGSTVANLVGQKSNRKHQNQINQENRDFQKEMYNISKADNLDFWNMQNLYNTPANQMKRFQEAGLNPNLIYGQGNTADKIASGQLGQGNAKAHPIDYGGALNDGIGAYINFRQSSAQVDNLLEQNKVLKQEALLKGLQGAKLASETEGINFDNSLKTELKQNSLDVAKQNLAKLTADTQFTTDSNKRADEMQTYQLQKINQEIDNLLSQENLTKAQIDIAREALKTEQAKAQMAQFDAFLTEQGVRPNDPLWNRYLNMFLEELLPKLLNQWDFQKPDNKNKFNWIK